MNGVHDQTLGKHVGRASYYHRCIIDRVSGDVLARVREAEVHAGCDTWNVVKVRRDQPHRVSLLTYQEFSLAFPALLESLTVDLVTGVVTARDYRERSNPPILHRKELLIGPDHPDFETFSALTRALDDLGLLTEAAGIGTWNPWMARLASAGVELDGHRISRRDAAALPVIHRHRAAIHRDGLSTPVQALLVHHLIEAGATLFDYGCGRGSDIRGLLALDIKASGWDPHFAPEAPVIAADVVNLGFVLNVIESPSEREDALRAAFALAGKCLAIAVIQPNAARWMTGRPFGDGIVTRLGTFQKFFTADEVKRLVHKTLQREAFAVGPGVFFVFKDADAEQEFLLKRQQRQSSTWSTTRRADRLNAQKQALADEIDRIADLALTLGRPPYADEIDSDVLAKIKRERASYHAVLSEALNQVGETQLALACQARRGDLSVFFALNIFNQRAGPKALPLRLQRDVKATFGTLAVGIDAARKLLFSLADVPSLRRAAEAAAEAGEGVLADDAFWCLATSTPRLPAILRCFIGCAERYFGGLEDAQVFKVHLESGKLTALSFAEFGISPLPRLKTRVKIDLRRQRIDVFDHDHEDQRLVGLGRLLARDDPSQVRQRAFDAALTQAGVDFETFRAGDAQIQAVLLEAGFIREGWRIHRAELQERPL